MLLAGIASGNVSAKPVGIVGDVNGDDVLSITDAVGIVSYILGEHFLSFSLDEADVNGDGKITITDAVFIVNLLLEQGAKPSIDTIKIVYQDDKVDIDGNFDNNLLKATVKGTKVKVVSSGKNLFVCMAEGDCSDGTLVIDADTTCTLILNNLQLTSQKSAAISFSKKQKASIELPQGSINNLSDASSREKGDDTKACLYSKGTMTFSGKGSLSVSGNYSHAIASSKNISVEGGHLIIDNVVKNGIHCDKFTLKKGQIDLHLQNDASKGIKAKEELTIKGGNIEGDASGGITIEDGDISYSTLLKSDSCMNVSDGAITLKHSGEGGRCISVDRNMTISGGTLSLECYGDGGQYINEDNEEDYYTPKCITVEDSAFINSGTISCLSTGVGGKGIVAGRYLSIGNLQREDEPTVNVETSGTCIIDDVDEDKRFGCPKGIKADERLNIYSGNISVHTTGQGGEGVECNDEMCIYGGTLECNTYDDGINVGNKLTIENGAVYCNSVNNDGVDSNGSIFIRGGIVASVNQKEPNESYDAEERQFHISGGTIIGIGSSSVQMDDQAILYYNTLYNVDPDKPARRGLRLINGKYIYVMDGEKLLLSIKNDNLARRGFVTVSLPEFQENHSYFIYQGDEPVYSEDVFFGHKLLFRGEPINKDYVIDIQPKYNYND